MRHWAAGAVATTGPVQRNSTCCHAVAAPDLPGAQSRAAHSWFVTVQGDVHMASLGLQGDEEDYQVCNATVPGGGASQLICCSEGCAGLWSAWPTGDALHPGRWVLQSLSLVCLAA